MDNYTEFNGLKFKKNNSNTFNNDYIDIGGLKVRKDIYEKRGEYQKAANKRRYEEEEKKKYHFGDITKGILSSGADLALDIGEGFLGTLEGVTDWGTYRIADIGEAFGADDFAKDLRGNADFNSTGALFGKNEKADENLFQKDWTKGIEESSIFNDTFDQIFQGVGNVGALAATSIVSGGSSLATIGASYTSAYGAARSKAKREGASDRDANRVGIINGIAEALSEQFFEGMPGMKVEGWGSKLTGKFADKVSKYFGSGAGKIALKTFDSMGEGFEEIISNSLVAVGNDLMHYYDSNFTYGMENQTGNLLIDSLAAWTDSESWSNFFSAAMTSALLGSARSVIDNRTQNKIINAYAKDNNMSFKDAKYILTGQTESAKQEIIRDKGEYNSNVELEKMAKQRILNYMRNTTGQNIESEIEKQITQQEEELGTKFSNEQKQQMRIDIRSMYEDRINSQDRYTEFTLDKEPTDEREKKLYESFKQNNRNNTKEAHDVYNFIKTLQDNNPTSNYRLTSNEELAKMGKLQRIEENGKVKYALFSKEGKRIVINGFKKGNTIYINADAKNPYQAVLGHEIGEAIKASDNAAYNDLKQLVKQVYGEGNLKRYQQIYDDLSDNVEDEYVNDRLGEMFQNNKLIDKISDNRNLLQKLIDEVKRLIKYIKSNNEQRQLQKLQKTLEDKYIELYKEADFNKKRTAFSLSEDLPKVKDGYTRLYRGLNNEYDPKYDRSSLDSPNGYDTLTDSYDLAKEYGKNIYYIDIPTNQITDSVIDENPNSETYGDRNLVYKDDKPASINGVKGNEYLLYTDHDNFNSEDYHKIDTNINNKYSLSHDSQGRELSKEQQEYFKDSKVRDENGNLKVMYHGSPNKNFTIFDITKAKASGLYGRGFYFTPYSTMAGNYNNFNKGKIFETYINSINPLTTKTNDITREQFKKFVEKVAENEDYSIENYGTNNIDEIVDLVYGKGDFGILQDINATAIGDLVEAVKLFNKVNKTNYDGIDVIDQFVVFEPNQIKNIDNTNPTTNEDIRYKLSNKETKKTGFENTQKIKDYTDYVESLNVPTTDRLGILTKEDYTNKKKELYEQYVDRAANKIEEQVKDVAKRNLELKNKDIADLRAITDKYKEMSREDIYSSNAKEELRQFVKDHAHQEYEEQIINNEIRDLQKDIRNREFIISYDYKGEFPDGLTKFKKNNPGINIKFGQKGNLDTELQELAELYPAQIDADVAYGDIPFVLADIMKQEYKQSKLEEFNLTDEEIDNITNKMFFGLTNNALSDKDIDKFVTTIQDKIRNKYARQMAIKEYRQLAKDMIGDISQIKDKKRGLLYQINTMKRNLRDIMTPDQASKMYDVYFKPISIHNAQIETDINEYNERISKYNLNNEESTYTQMLGELKYNPKTSLTTTQVDEYLQKHKNKIDTKKVNSAIEEFREIYDELIVRVNESLEANGYKPIDYRTGYFPHFIEDKADTMLGKFAEKLGWQVKKGQLPTDIAGLTDEFQPGKVWTSFSQQRIGDATDYNALKGMDNYLRGAMDVIYHTQDIQRLRALEAEIRYQYSDKGVQQKLDEIYNNQDLTNEEKYAQAALVTENVKDNPLGNFATELRNYTNNLANKKAIGDRGMEQTLGRDMYSIMNNISSRVSANMVGANISSAMTNFIPLTQAWSQIKTKNMLKGILSTIKASIRDDGFSQNSVYLTNRTKQAEKLFKTKLEKAVDVLGKPFEAVDSFTSNVIVRAKYFENLEKGMNEVDAMNNADEFAKDVMAGRSKGDSPTMFNKKNPLAKLFTAFQLEVNNQYGYMFKDIKVDIGKEAKDKLAMAFMKLFLGAWIYNMFSEKITGRKAAFSPIDMVADEAKIITNENMDLATKLQNLSKNIVQEAPFVGGIMGGGRLPIQSAIPYSDPVSFVTETATNVGGLFDDEKREKAINSLIKEWSKPLYFVALPVAGGQIKKSVEGMRMYTYDTPGSYTDSGKIRFEADTSPLGMLQAFVFGQYASENAREYFDSGANPLTEKQLQEAQDANLPLAEYREINRGINKVKKIAKDNKESQSEAQYDYIYNLPISIEQKNSLLNSKLKASNNVEDDNGYIKYTDGNNNYWYDAENDIVYNSKYRKMNNIDISDLTKYSNLKDISDYGNYSSLEEYNYAYNNPEKYAAIQQVTNYNNYIEYRNEITAIKDDYSNGTEKGRKLAQQKVFDYINSLPLNQYQKVILQKLAGGYSIKSYEKSIFDYINKQDLTKEEKQKIHKELFGNG